MLNLEQLEMKTRKQLDSINHVSEGARSLVEMAVRLGSEYNLSAGTVMSMIMNNLKEDENGESN